MKRIKFYKFFLWLVSLFFIIGLPISVMAAEKTIELKYATSFDRHRDHEWGTRTFVEKLQKSAGDRLKIVYKGGPEAIPPFELGEAVRKGIVDFSSGVGGYYASMIPEANAVRLTQFLPWELRANGALDFMKKVWLERKANFIPIAWFEMGGGGMYHFYSKVKINKIDDFKGLKIRSTPTYKDFIIALGATPIQMPHGEIYTSLERGLVQAVASPAFGVTEMGWQTQVKYTVFPAFWEIDQGIIFNWDSWKRLPKDLQKLIDDIGAQVERDSHEFILKVVQKQYDDLKKAGLEEVKVDDPQRFLQIGYEAAWKDVLSKSDPKYGPEMRRLLTKTK
jgi:TRAP-type C4-dicarboxylate transport system substrate-binding protein